MKLEQEAFAYWSMAATISKRQRHYGQKNLGRGYMHNEGGGYAISILHVDRNCIFSLMLFQRFEKIQRIQRPISTTLAPIALRDILCTLSYYRVLQNYESLLNDDHLDAQKRGLCDTYTSRVTTRNDRYSGNDWLTRTMAYMMNAQKHVPVLCEIP